MKSHSSILLIPDKNTKELFCDMSPAGLEYVRINTSIRDRNLFKWR